MPSLLLSTAAVVMMIGLPGVVPLPLVPSAMMRPVWVTMIEPGLPTVEPATTGPERGWPRMIEPAVIVSVAPFFTKIGLSRTYSPFQVVFTVMSVVQSVGAALALPAPPARASASRIE